MVQLAREALEAIYESKKRGHLQLAALPIEEKVRRIIMMQEQAAGIAVSQGRKPPMVWKLPSKFSTP